jgi:hypothetical protein
MSGEVVGPVFIRLRDAPDEETPWFGTRTEAGRLAIWQIADSGSFYGDSFYRYGTSYYEAFEAVPDKSA